MSEVATQTSRWIALRAWLWSRREGLLFIALGLIGFALTVYLCAPGFMARDSGTQLEQARRFEFWDDHPVLMALLWHYTDLVLPGPLGMLALMTAVCWAGLAVLFWALPGPLLWRAGAFLAVGFFPPVFSTYPIILKDALMHGALLLGLGCIVLPSRRALPLRLFLALVFFAVAIGIRHNAAAAVWPFVALPLLRLPFLNTWSRWLRLAVASAVALGISFVLTVGLDRALSPLTNKTEFWQTVPTYDLAGMSIKTGQVLVEPGSPVFAEGMGLAEIRRMFKAEYGAAIYYCIPFGGKRCVNVFRLTTDRKELRQLRDNWMRAIRQHPGAYLSHKWDLTRKLMTVSKGPKELYYLDGAPHHRLAKGYPPTRRGLRVMKWMERHIRWVGYRPWVYVALSALLMPAALRRYSREGKPLPLLYLLSGAAYLLSTILGANSSNYRYSVWTILCSVLAAVTLLAYREVEPSNDLRDRVRSLVGRLRHMRV